MCSRILRALAGLAALAAASCSPPEKVHPALWQVDGPHGERAWLFGTIHALPRPVDLHAPAFDRAMAASDRIVLEVATIDDDAATAAAFSRLASTPGLPPLEQRVRPRLRAPLVAALRHYRVDPERTTNTETWAVALLIAQEAQQAAKADSGNGVDRALLRLAAGKRTEEFEGATAQLAIFDSLPEREQQDMLALVVADAGEDEAGSARLAAAWANGDVAALTAQTRTGLLADPELRQALLIDRNRAWLGKLEDMLRHGARPFVAVGAAHIVGPDGLAAQLAARGYRVTRLQ